MTEKINITTKDVPRLKRQVKIWELEKDCGFDDLSSPFYVGDVPDPFRVRCLLADANQKSSEIANYTIGLVLASLVCAGCVFALVLGILTGGLTYHDTGTPAMLAGLFIVFTPVSLIVLIAVFLGRWRTIHD